MSQEEYAEPEDRDEYLAENIFWVPKEARWSRLQSNAKQPEIGKLIDEGMAAIEKENPTLKGVLPKDYGKPALDKRLLASVWEIRKTALKTFWGRYTNISWGSLPMPKVKEAGSFTPRPAWSSC